MKILSLREKKKTLRLKNADKIGGGREPTVSAGKKMQGLETLKKPAPAGGEGLVKEFGKPPLQFSSAGETDPHPRLLEVREKVHAIGQRTS